MEENKTLPIPIQQAVEDALSAWFGGRVEITEVQNFWPSCVFRCTLQPSSHATPHSVIVRVPREGTVESGGLQNEQAALQYLTEIGSPLAPQVLAGGSTAGFLITEDLADHPSLLDLLLGNAPEIATQGLLAFAQGLGMLHAQTAGPGDCRRLALPTAPVPVIDHWQQVMEAVAQLGLPAAHGVDGDVAAIARLLAEPSDCLALSSGDPSVVNCKIINGSARFFDFERACFRHALVDATVLRYPYPTGGPPWSLPPEIAVQIEAAYRTALAQVCVVAQDDNHYEQGLAAACAAWTILRLVRLPRVDAGPDRDRWLLLPPDWSGAIPIRSRRRQLVSILTTFIASARCADTFEALAAWCEHLVDALSTRWPEAIEELPFYPAFAQGRLT